MLAILSLLFVSWFCCIARSAALSLNFGTNDQRRQIAKRGFASDLENFLEDVIPEVLGVENEAVPTGGRGYGSLEKWYSDNRHHRHRTRTGTRTHTHTFTHIGTHTPSHTAHTRTTHTTHTSHVSHSSHTTHSSTSHSSSSHTTHHSTTTHHTSSHKPSPTPVPKSTSKPHSSTSHSKSATKSTSKSATKSPSPSPVAPVAPPPPSPPSPGTVTSSSLSAEATQYLAAHNIERNLHGAPPLTWSDTLASAALDWTKKCQFKHTGGIYGPYGENLAAGTGNFQPISAVQQWVAEASTYNASNPQPSHFTQVVWKSTSEVGCAVTACSGIFDPSLGLAQFHACFYKAAGNVLGEFSANVQV